MLLKNDMQLIHLDWDKEKRIDADEAALVITALLSWIITPKLIKNKDMKDVVLVNQWSSAVMLIQVKDCNTIFICLLET